MSEQLKTFSREGSNEFFKVLKKRVNAHFQETGISRHANANMVIKTITVGLMYLIPYIIILTAGVTNTLAFMGLWLAMGVGMAGIGLCVMHDANHGAYSRKKWVNTMLGKGMNLIGGNADSWKCQHNVLHHTYTNVYEADDDLNAPAVLRLSPYDPYMKAHRFQWLYVWFFYGIATLTRVTFREGQQLFRYRELGLFNSDKDFRKVFTRFLAWKAWYYTYIIVIPALVCDVSFGVIIASFLVMHFCAGIIMSMIFQTAHVMPNITYDAADANGVVQQNWAKHEMMTTSNYAPKSRIFAWFVGGLNYQVEHHLFPNICHVHYPGISKIVAETAAEYNIPYNSYKTFIGAATGHVKMLYMLGRLESYPQQTPAKEAPKKEKEPEYVA